MRQARVHRSATRDDVERMLLEERVSLDIDTRISWQPGPVQRSVE